MTLMHSHVTNALQVISATEARAINPPTKTSMMHTVVTPLAKRRNVRCVLRRIGAFRLLAIPLLESCAMREDSHFSDRQRLFARIRKAVSELQRFAAFGGAKTPKMLQATNPPNGDSQPDLPMV